MKVDPHVFFKFHENKLVAWNYRTHEQFELTQAYFERLFEFGTGALSAPDSSIDSELIDAKLISPACQAQHWGWDCLSHIFHFGTNSILAPGEALPVTDSSSTYIEYCETMDTDAEPVVIQEVSGEIFELPPPDVAKLQNTSLWDALMARKTCREFTGAAVDLTAVSNILYATFGAVHGPDRRDVDSFGIESYGYRRTSPSGGSLQTAEPYLVNFTIRDLPIGIYHYHSIDHKLTRTNGELPSSDLGPLLAGQNFANELGFAIFMVSRFDKMWWKYPHSRAYRVALMDVGHLSQTFHLACTAYSLKTWLTAVFYDEELAKRFNLDLSKQAVMLMVGAGVGDGSSISPGIIESLKSR